MKIPAFIKQLVKFCDTESSRYALGSIEAKRLADGIAKLTATDGRILATVHWQDEEDGPAMDVLVSGKQLASPPAAAFKARDSDCPRFDGSTLTYGSSSIKPEPCDGRFPEYEKLFTIHSDTRGYVAVKLDPSYLKTLCELAQSIGGETCKGLTLFVRGSQECVFAEARSGEGYVARMAIMPLAADADGNTFPPRPGRTVAAETTAAESVVEEEQPAPPPEFMDDEQVAAAIAEPADLSVALDPI